MAEAVVAFAFGVPDTLLSNRLIAMISSEKARLLNIPVYTQLDVMPLDPGVAVELTEETYPARVPTLRIARGAVRWAQARSIDTLWLCAAKPHLARTCRDLSLAVGEAGATITVKVCERIDDHPTFVWFCKGSRQLDTRLAWMWILRDAILLHMPTRLYAKIAG